MRVTASNKIKALFSFLHENRIYNHQVQRNYYRSLINSTISVQENILSLLYAVANTQSRPNINHLAAFFKYLHVYPDCLNSFDNFIQYLDSDAESNFKCLFHGLSKQKGWGDKTSALFTKSIYHIHSNTYDDELRLWDDAPRTIGEDDTIYLPVDAVILAIFSRIDDSQQWSFRSINKLLSSSYNNSDMVIWDDLWFWGFITQKSIGNARLFEWNENKYWILKECDKNPHKINDIKKKADEFLNILNIND
ncbi:MAG: hypothetical protein HLUCCA01_00040 [Bacteroidetes bacterium HLUCCA01]|nr:MAG: hypothetical protein HLUCCA01_00040 [Bacteroidetes bacterium HLUCCA01]